MMPTPTVTTDIGDMYAPKSMDMPSVISGNRSMDPEDRSTGPPPQIGRVPTPDHTIPRTAEYNARDEIISINRFDIQSPPLTLWFGEFNPRQLSPAGVQTLTTEFLYEMFTPFKMECKIPILLRTGDISDVCINLDLTRGPELVLTDDVSTKELK
jgi:hypothetical protein